LTDLGGGILPIRPFAGFPVFFSVAAPVPKGFVSVLDLEYNSAWQVSHPPPRQRPCVAFWRPDRQRLFRCFFFFDSPPVPTPLLSLGGPQRPFSVVVLSSDLLETVPPHQLPLRASNGQTMADRRADGAVLPGISLVFFPRWSPKRALGWTQDPWANASRFCFFNCQQF